jgi:hypothetical protein
MTNQEAFDKVALHLSKMPGRCWNQEDESCEYLREDGNRCAIGSLLTQEEAESVDNISVVELMRDDNINVPSLAGLDRLLLQDLQRLHDNSNHWEDDRFDAWSELIRMGEIYNLDVSQVIVAKKLQRKERSVVGRVNTIK